MAATGADGEGWGEAAVGEELEELEEVDDGDDAAATTAGEMEAGDEDAVDAVVGLHAVGAGGGKAQASVMCQVWGTTPCTHMYPSIWNAPHHSLHLVLAAGCRHRLVHAVRDAGPGGGGPAAADGALWAGGGQRGRGRVAV